MIEFILNNQIVKTDSKSGLTLLHFIREVRRMKGTKSGCKEGDCGACTVLSGSIQKNGTLKYDSITSCLTPLANVQNKHIVTVEGLNLKEELNISQLAIKDNHGTQCGFCTPGFVISLSNYALDNSNDGAIEYLSGNICRCTGYKSIEKAAKQLEKSLQNKSINDDLNWLISNKFIPEYFATIPERLKALSTAPTNNAGILVGGGTDLYVRCADKLGEENIKTLDGLVSKDITFSDNICILGGGVTVSDIMHNEIFNTYFPNLQKHLKLVSSKQIRNMGSIAGNFVNASPIGDMSIFFLALDSNLKIINNEGEERLIKLNTFFKDYKSFDLKKDEIIKETSFLLPTNNSFFNFEKVSKRTHLDIASVNSAMFIKLNKDKISEANISIGGVSAIPKYLFKTSKFLTGKSLSKDIILDASIIMQNEISPISDVRGSEQYKRLLSRQLFFAHFIESLSEKIAVEDLINV